MRMHAKWMLGLVVGAVAASCARWVLGLALGTLGASTAAWAISDDTSRATPAELAAATRIAAPGRVEGATETIEVASAVDGVVARVFVHEGDLVAVGQPIAEIDCRELEFEVRSLTASRDARLADRVRLLEGGRPDEPAGSPGWLDVAIGGGGRGPGANHGAILGWQASRDEVSSRRCRSGAGQTTGDVFSRRIDDDLR